MHCILYSTFRDPLYSKMSLFELYRSVVCDMRLKYVPSISSRIRYWAIRPDVSGISTPSATSTTSTAIGIASRLSSIITRAAEG